MIPFSHKNRGTKLWVNHKNISKVALILKFKIKFLIKNSQLLASSIPGMFLKGLDEVRLSVLRVHKHDGPREGAICADGHLSAAGMVTLQTPEYRVRR